MGIRDKGKNIIDVRYLGKPCVKVMDKGVEVWSRTSDYIVLPYIVSNGNAWADTGLYLDPTIHRVQGSFIVDNFDLVSRSDIYPLEGARSQSTTGAKVNITIKKLSADTYQVRRDWGRSGSGDYDTAVYETGKEYFFDFTPEYTEINGVRIDRVPDTIGACLTTYYIGYQNDTWDLWGNGYYPPATRPTKRIFSVYATGEIIGESLSTLNLSDKTFNMYDSVTKKYLENKGTEPFTGAYEAWVYEMGRPLSYLQSDGKCYVDTGYIPDIENDYMYIKGQRVLEGVNSYWFGNYRANTPNTIRHLATLASPPTLRLYDEINGTASLAVSSVVQDLSVLEILKNTKNINVNGEDKGDIARTYQKSTTSIWLYSMGSTTYVSPAKDKIFAFQAGASKDNLSVDLIPFITWEGIKGFLNLVNRELLLNQGTGEFQVPTIPVYAINWQDEDFDPIVGKVARIGSLIGFTSIKYLDWTEAQKEVFRGKKIKVSFKISAKDVSAFYRQYVGFENRIDYVDGTYSTINANIIASVLFSGMTPPYNLAEDYSYSSVIQLEDKDIATIMKLKPYFYLPSITSGELKVYDIKWEVDVPEWEIDAIETLTSIGIAANADYQENKTLLNSLGIEA